MARKAKESSAALSFFCQVVVDPKPGDGMVGESFASTATQHRLHPHFGVLRLANTNHHTNHLGTHIYMCTTA